MGVEVSTVNGELGEHGKLCRVGEFVEPVAGCDMVGGILAGFRFDDLHRRCDAAEEFGDPGGVFAPRLVLVGDEHDLLAGEDRPFVVIEPFLARALRRAHRVSAGGLHRLNVLLAFDHENLLGGTDAVGVEEGTGTLGPALSELLVGAAPHLAAIRVVVGGVPAVAVAVGPAVGVVVDVGQAETDRAEHVDGCAAAMAVQQHRIVDAGDDQ